jgi:hypothetical protein
LREFRQADANSFCRLIPNAALPATMPVKKILSVWLNISMTLGFIDHVTVVKQAINE